MLELMTNSETNRDAALYTICLFAAFADGGKSDSEREHLKSISESMLPEGYQPATLYRQVLLKQTTLADQVPLLDSPEWRQLAYEMAVHVCEADGQTSEKEKSFLTELASHLQIEATQAQEMVRQGDALAASSPENLLPPAIIPAPQETGIDAQADSTIMRYSIINGALELLPETLSTMAIIPLQMKLVNAVGKFHGYSLDKRQILEFLGAAGIGATSQVLEGYARKFLGGFMGKMGKQVLGKSIGGFAKKGADQLTSSAFSFASTWAIGQLAKRYYANGRSWSGIDAKATYENFQQQAAPLYQKVLPQIQEQASGLNYAKVLSMVRGQP
ncbi:MAG: GTPase [Verrucomicrobia bacterium]|nr:MAG: GTPase [Verrucomicrobiota bacterium]